MRWSAVRKISPFACAVGIAFTMFCFLALTLPLAFERPSGGRSAERQAYTGGIIRNYCLEPSHPSWLTPQIHFGQNPFNLELPVFEKLEGVLARAIAGPECDSSVEVVGKTVSILFSVFALMAVAILATDLWGPLAGLLAAIILGSDELWLRYSTYTMIENRVLALGLFAIVFSLRRRAGLATIFWILTFLQKPQIFVFLTTFWGALELLSAKSLGALVQAKRFRHVVLGFVVSCGVGAVWYGWNSRLNAQSDLPWIIHTGPRAVHWYFGDWGERLKFGLYKNILVSWFRDSGVNVGLPALVVLGAVGRQKGLIEELLRRSAPFLAALAVYNVLFYAVFIVHEYYALPLNVARALTTGGVLALITQASAGLMASRNKTERSSAGRRKRMTTLRTPLNVQRAAIAGLVLVGVVTGRFVVVGTRDYATFALNVNNPAASFYHTEWDRQIFPEKNSAVVLALSPPGTGRDLLYLYLTKQRGFLWCAVNEQYAPRAYWKAQGIKYVAWGTGVDPKTRHLLWTVRTLDEELRLARDKGWSSDIRDVWAAHPMGVWARLASQSGKDPCLNPRDYDPRTWE